VFVIDEEHRKRGAFARFARKLTLIQMRLSRKTMF